MLLHAELAHDLNAQRSLEALSAPHSFWTSFFLDQKATLVEEINIDNYE